jgi:hypothetical protein
MTETEAIEQLEGADVVTYARVNMRYGKEVVATCLGAGLPAALTRDAACGVGGCSPKVAVVVRRDDVPRIATLLHTQWAAMARSEGDLDPDLRIGVASAGGQPALEVENDEPPCPACGTAAPLVSGACADCGLVLE